MRASDDHGLAKTGHFPRQSHGGQSPAKRDGRLERSMLASPKCPIRLPLVGLKYAPFHYVGFYMGTSDFMVCDPFCHQILILWSAILCVTKF
jgi:hypothetical protein